jgi:glycosyltransferase involved in cell wall biosynthesis
MTFHQLFILIFFISHASFMIGWVLMGYLKLRRRNVQKKPGIGLSQITVVIPFRNEAKRIAPLLRSILQSKDQPASYVFVDDHSTDGTEALISEKLTSQSYTILSVKDSIQGKKQAILLGVQCAQTEYVLTLDADVSFDINYFKNLGLIQSADLHVLPVKINAGNTFSELLQQDVQLANFVNLGTTGWLRPIMCSGANLLFRKVSFLNEVVKSNYFEKSSGDDVYLLKLFQLSGKKIQTHISTKLEVITQGAQTVHEYIDQRTRWIGKSRHVADSLANSMIIVQFILAISFWIAFALAIVNLSATYFMIFLFVKIALDAICLYPFYHHNHKIKTWMLLPGYIFLLPLINCFLLLLSIGYSPRWKDRLIVN